MTLGRQVGETLSLLKNLPEDVLATNSGVIKFGILGSSGRSIKNVRANCSYSIMN